MFADDDATRTAVSAALMVLSSAGAPGGFEVVESAVGMAYSQRISEFAETVRDPARLASLLLLEVLGVLAASLAFGADVCRESPDEYAARLLAVLVADGES